MNIFIDLELESDYNPNDYGREAKALQKVLKDYYSERMKVLNDEIEKEENEQLLINKVAFVVLPLLYEHNPIYYFNYSPGLREKMKGCYSPADANYLNMKFQETLKSFDN